MRNFGRRGRLLLILCGVVFLGAAGMLLRGVLQRVQAERVLSKTAVEVARQIPDGKEGAAMLVEELPRLAWTNGDIVGLLEIPDAGICLPVYAEEAAQTLPTLSPAEGGGARITAAATAWQLACLIEAEAGQAVVFTDLLGNRYTYAVQSIRHPAAAQLSGLSAAEGELLLAARKGGRVVMAVCRRTTEDCDGRT